MTKKNNVKDFCCFSVYLLIEVQVISSVLFAIVVMGVVAVVEVGVVAVVVVEGFFSCNFWFFRGSSSGHYSSSSGRFILRFSLPTIKIT